MQLMDFCKPSLCLCLLALAAVAIGQKSAVEVQDTEPEDTSTTDSCKQGNNDYTEMDVACKVPIIGRRRLLTGTKYGLIERSYSQIALFNGQSPNNTWRIVCETQKNVFAIIMNMHLKFDDYLQIKLKKLTGEIGDKFEYLHFSKRSVLVSIATNSSRDLFAPQSSFVLGYMCINNTADTLETTMAFLDNNKVLKYMRCRPNAFKKLAQQLTDNFYHFTTTDQDIQNMLNIKNDKESEVVPLPCTNTPIVSECTESSADGSIDEQQ